MLINLRLFKQIC